MRALPLPCTSTALAQELGGRHVGVEQTVTAVAGPDDDAPGHLVWLRAAHPLRGVALVDVQVEGTCIVLDDPQGALFALLQDRFPEPGPTGQHPTAVLEGQVHPTVRAGAYAVVEPGASVGPRTVLHASVVVRAGAVVGSDCVLHPGVVVYPDVTLGRGCRIHAGAVLGSDGFGYEPGPDGLIKVPHAGRVVLGDHVEVGANATVDRAMLGATRLGDGVKLDNLVQVAHNVEIGAHTVIAGQAGVAGSASIGAGVQVGGQAGVRDHVSVGDGAQIGAQSGVARDVPARARVFGSPARPLRQALRLVALLDRMVRKG
jgi:UDP-3-O-[3-hydroxymyristoyl] glucosamine N-acyltransferase